MVQYCRGNPVGDKSTGLILIRGARQLLTLRGSSAPRRGAQLKELGIISDGSLLIKDGVIDQVGSTRRVENLACARGAVEISAIGRVVMPGFVDSHTHLVFPPPGASAQEIEGAVRSVRSETGQRLQVRTQAYMEAMARHGTTTVEAKTGCGPDESAETKLLRVLGALKNDPLQVVPTFLFSLPQPGRKGSNGDRAALEWVLAELLPKILRRGFAHFADLAWDDDPSRQEFFVRYLDAARKLSLPCKIHACHDRPAAAIAMAIRQFAVAIDHLEHATPADAALLAGTATLATLLPCTSFCNGGRNAPARAIIDAGGAVALATDFNPQHTPTLSMQTVVALACLRLGMSPAEAISAATINSAYALGCDQQVGSLEVGKVADLVILNTSDYRDLTNNFGMNLVHMTMKRGRLIYKEGDVAPRAAWDSSVSPSLD
jgi:imidazolonepropionase